LPVVLTEAGRRGWRKPYPGDCCDRELCVHFDGLVGLERFAQKVLLLDASGQETDQSFERTRDLTLLIALSSGRKPAAFSHKPQPRLYQLVNIEKVYAVTFAHSYTWAGALPNSQSPDAVMGAVMGYPAATTVPALSPFAHS
jgi:hypothetical protein